MSASPIEEIADLIEDFPLLTMEMPLAWLAALVRCSPDAIDLAEQLAVPGAFEGAA